MKLDKILWLALVASLVLALGSVVACGDDDDDDDDDAADDDSADDDDDDDDSGDDDADYVAECEAWYAECGVDDGGACASLDSYTGMGSCYDAALGNLFDCLTAAGCSDAEALGACYTDFASEAGAC